VKFKLRIYFKNGYCTLPCWTRDCNW